MAPTATWKLVNLNLNTSRGLQVEYCDVSGDFKLKVNSAYSCFVLI